MLEINARPGRHLRQLIELIGEPRVLRELDIHRTTLRRWLKEEIKIPGHQHQVIRLLLGDLPGTAGQWSGWRFDQGLLIAPGGDRYRPGDVLSLIILRQQLTAQRRELEALRVKLAISEEAVERLAPAANESRAWG
jgi:transposase-like protein